MPYTLKVLRDVCISAGSCVIDAPLTFGFDDDDIAIIIDPRGDSDENILEAAQGCPTDAIIVIDSETQEQVWPEG